MVGNPTNFVKYEKKSPHQRKTIYPSTGMSMRTAWFSKERVMSRVFPLSKSEHLHFSRRVFSQWEMKNEYEATAKSIAKTRVHRLVLGETVDDMKIGVTIAYRNTHDLIRRNR